MFQVTLLVSQLKEFVEQVNAKTVIPIHTENAEIFQRLVRKCKTFGGSRRHLYPLMLNLLSAK